MKIKKIILQFSFLSKFKILINFNNPIIWSQRELLLLKSYVPGIKVEYLKSRVVNNENFFIIDYYRGCTQKFSYNKNSICIYDNWSEEIPLYFFHLIYGVLHGALSKNHKYTIHSACVGRNNKWMLLVGHSGSGKTTVALKMLNSYKFKMFSSNKTVLEFKNNNINAIAGTNTITVKKNDYRIKNHNNIGKIEFANRIAYELDKKYTALNKMVEVKNIYLIKINPAVRELSLLDNFEAMVILYPFLLDYINSDILISKSNIYDGGISVGKKEKNKLLKVLGQSLKYSKVYFISGSIDFISKEINKTYA